MACEVALGYITGKKADSSFASLNTLQPVAIQIQVQTHFAHNTIHHQTNISDPNDDDYWRELYFYRIQKYLGLALYAIYLWLYYNNQHL